MIFSKINFFLLLGLFITGGFVGYKVNWLAHSRRIEGVFSFVGYGEAGEQIRLDYSVCWFRLGKDTVWFNGVGNLPYQEGDSIPVRYQVGDAGDARVDVFAAVWGDTLVYSGIPLFMLLVAYLHPAVVPRGKRLKVAGRRPFVVLV